MHEQKDFPRTNRFVAKWINGLSIWRSNSISEIE